MAQKREKEEGTGTLDLKVPAPSPSLSSCPDNCKQNIPNPSRSTSVGPDAARLDLPLKAQAQARSEIREEDNTATVPAAEERKQPPRGGGATAAVNRCTGCGKRVGLTGFRCRCGDLFCREHRYSDRHDCTYDYKAAGREAIARENPLVRAPKILKV